MERCCTGLERPLGRRGFRTGSCRWEEEEPGSELKGPGWRRGGSRGRSGSGGSCRSGASSEARQDEMDAHTTRRRSGSSGSRGVTGQPVPRLFCLLRICVVPLGSVALGRDGWACLAQTLHLSPTVVPPHNPSAASLDPPEAAPPLPDPCAVFIGCAWTESAGG